MIDLDWLSDCLCDILRWQIAHPGRTDGPEIPYAGLRLWGLFMRLHEARGGGGFGPGAITYSEMRALGESLRPWEIDILRAMDQAFLEAAGKAAEKPSEVSSRPMSVALFDAVFQRA